MCIRDSRGPLQQALQAFFGDRVLVVKSGSDGDEELEDVFLESAAGGAVRVGTQHAREVLQGLDAQLDEADLSDWEEYMFLQ